MGNSNIVKYNGAGAYFLDRIESGVWRLEVMPDAVWLHDPFERTSPKKKVAAVQWNTSEMKINLPDLGSGFSIRGINDRNPVSTKTTDGGFSISPGTYLLTRNGVTAKVKPTDKWKTIALNEFAAPPSSLEKIFVKHKPSNSTPGQPYEVEAVVAAADELESVQVFAWLQGFRPEVIDMQTEGANIYRATIPGDKIKEGLIRYHIVVKEKGKSYTFPSGLPTHPRDWDFFDREPYEVRVLPTGSPVLLFNTATDVNRLSRRWVRTSTVKPSFDPGKSELQVNIEKLFIPDPENPKASKLYDYSMRFYVGDKLAGNGEILSSKKKIVLTGSSLNDKPCKFQIALLTTSGSAFGGVITLQPDKKDYELKMSDLKPVRLVTLPRPYPTFLSYFFDNKSTESFDISNVEAIQLSIGPGMSESEAQEQHGISIESIRLE